ncbi:MAG: SDR family oxidoreductase [Deltaproteobacteria bacterium]
METISVLGCGWLGLPLARYLIEKGYDVKGSTRTPTELEVMRASGIEPFYLVLDPDLRGDNLDDFFKSDVIVINFPPERRPDIVDYHRDQINALLPRLGNSPAGKVIFASSTSVYPELNREVSEDEEALPAKPSGLALMEAERLLQGCPEFETTVIRFGGLIGYDRRPGRFLAGKKEIANGDSPVNLIHRDDCIAIILKIIEKSVWGETFNACADSHPKRKDYYTAQAGKLGLEPPVFNKSGQSSYKIVTSDKLKRLLGYEFIYPDPSSIDDGQK